MTVATHNPALDLADRWQRDFPLHPEPFATAGGQLDLTSNEVIEMLQSLKDQGCLARIGAAVRPNTAGASTLAAMAVPPHRLDVVAEMVNAHPAVNHNYEREHALNLWFVVTAADRGAVRQTLDAIAQQTGVEVLDLPLVRPYHIDLGFRLSGDRRKPTAPHRPDITCEVDAADKALLCALEDGLKLVDRPYAALADRLGWAEMQVIDRLNSLLDRGIISRFGCILRHRRLGYRANAMAVWNVPDGEVDRIAAQLAARDEVTLCYRRARHMPLWPFNLFAMVHGRERDAVTYQVATAAESTGLAQYQSAVLFSRRCFKQSAARLMPDIRGAA